MTTSPFVNWPAGETLVLASRSPRRAELLQIAGIPFEVRVAGGGVEEQAAAELAAQRTAPGPYGEALALVKAQEVASSLPGRLVLGADTVVILDDEILEKPTDEEDAVRILSRLAGRRHVVITAIALLGRRAPWLGHERTTVEFLPLDETAIRRYVATGEPMDKAGAYGIQGFGAMMVRAVDGCYFNVMGLPLALLGRALREVLAP
jgi:septum formation protein